MHAFLCKQKTTTKKTMLTSLNSDSEQSGGACAGFR